jgi:hypothetical protein
MPIFLMYEGMVTGAGYITLNDIKLVVVQE